MAHYKFYDFLKNDRITISTAAQEAPHYPFTLQSAREFFKHFEGAGFSVDHKELVRSIYIYSGKNNLPGHSFAHGYLLTVPLETYEAHGLSGIPDAIGSLSFEYGGETKTPSVRVTLAPSGSSSNQRQDDRGPAPGRGSGFSWKDSGTSGGTTGAKPGKKGRKGRIFLAIVAIVVLGSVISKAIKNIDHSGLKPVGNVVAASLPGEPVIIPWGHDLSFQWWQPVLSKGYPVWVDKGDWVQIVGTGNKSHIFRWSKGADPVAFGWKGTLLVKNAQKRLQKLLINKQEGAKVLGIQARTHKGIPQIYGERMAFDMVDAGMAEVTQEGFLYICPNLPQDRDCLTEGFCNLTVTIYAKDGKVTPPDGHNGPSLLITLGKNGNVRSGPSTSTKIQKTAKKGTTFRCVSREGSWYHVEIESDHGNPGAWVHQSLVSGHRIEY